MTKEEIYSLLEGGKINMPEYRRLYYEHIIRPANNQRKLDRLKYNCRRCTILIGKDKLNKKFYYYNKTPMCKECYDTCKELGNIDKLEYLC